MSRNESGEREGVEAQEDDVSEHNKGNVWTYLGVGGIHGKMEVGLVSLGVTVLRETQNGSKNKGKRRKKRKKQ